MVSCVTGFFDIHEYRSCRRIVIEIRGYVAHKPHKVKCHAVACTKTKLTSYSNFSSTCLGLFLEQLSRTIDLSWTGGLSDVNFEEILAQPSFSNVVAFTFDFESLYNWRSVSHFVLASNPVWDSWPDINVSWHFWV